MKTWKRIASVVLMMMMLVTMILPVWGDDPVTPTPATITVKNLPAGTTSVNVYQVCEYNYAGRIIKDSSPWLMTVVAYTGDTEPILEYVGNGIRIPFSSGVDYHNINFEAGFNASDFAAYLKANMPTGATAQTVTVTNGEAVITPASGFYLIDAGTIAFGCDLNGTSLILDPAGTNSNDGKITINNAVKNETYTIYQILKLESFNQALGAYAYKATTAWSSFVNDSTIKSTYLNVDAQDYVTWVEGADAAAFAKLAKEWAADASHSITNQGTATATTTTVEFANLNLGYYLVDTSLGTLCSLDTTDKQVTIKEKNAVPTVTKQVQEDSKAGEDDEWGAVNDADFGQVVNFKTTIEAKKGADSYVLHDEMDAGLTFDQSSVKIYKGSVDSANIVDNTNYELYDASSVVAGSDPEEKVIKDNCTFEIHFEQTYLDTITADTKLIVTYSATLNTNAVVGDNGNVNKTWLTYGDSSKTETANTTTYTWDFNVFKYTGTDTPLSGAEFELTKGTGSTITTYKFVDITTNTDTYPVYRISVDGDKTNTSVTVLDKITTDATGKFAIVGLDQDTYTLEEDTAPAGYNKLADTITVYVEKNTSNVIQIRYKPTKAEAESGTVPTDKTVPVLNNSGTELPSTGGVGTTIFYCAGAVLALGAFVLLITRKRMQKQ